MRTPLLPFTPALLALALAVHPAAQEAMPNFGHARARELAELGRLPTTHDVVVRDIVNYHRHRLPLPRADEDVSLDLRFDRSFATPEDRVVLQVGYTTRAEGNRAFVQPASIALVVDCSGSMAERGKMDQVKRGLCAFVQQLRNDDEVELIAFSSDARTVAERRPCGRDRRWLLCAIDDLRPENGTNLHAGLMLGLRRIAGDGLRDAEPGRARRVVLLTDGIANHGVTDPAQILADARPYMNASIDISTIGVGESLDVNLLEKLARGTRGLFHFVGDEKDVQKVFVQEAESLLMPVARRPRLEITLPRDLRVEHVFQEGWRERDGQIVVDLPDFNAGVTGVVIVRCRVAQTAREELAARAELTFEVAATARKAATHASAELRLGSSDRRLERDLEVQKNHAIAVLAQGLRDMAEASESKRWTEADRALRLARDEAQRLFPGNDPDLQRVIDIAAGHARTLQRYVDRFRDY
ncbi:MAG TPA: VWA domain-containing protein [Planctomycetota bacterium]